MSWWRSWGATGLLLAVGFTNLAAGGGILYASVVEEDPFLAIWTALPWVVGAVAIAWGLERILPTLHVRDLRIEMSDVRRGQPINGQLVLEPWFGATLHRIELQLIIEEADHQDQRTVRSTLATVPVCDRQVIKGPLTLRFAIPLPQEVPASYEDHDLAVRYVLKSHIQLPYRLKHQQSFPVTVEP